MTIFPHFSGRYNEIIAASLFFPMAFATVSANLGARFLVQGVFYVHRRWRAVQSAGEESGAPTAETSNSTTSSNEDISSPLILYKDIERPMDTLPMVSFSHFVILLKTQEFLGALVFNIIGSIGF